MPLVDHELVHLPQKAAGVLHPGAAQQDLGASGPALPPLPCRPAHHPFLKPSYSPTVQACKLYNTSSYNHMRVGKRAVVGSLHPAAESDDREE